MVYNITMRKYNIQKGSVGEGRFIGDCLERGINISIPVMPTSYDFITESSNGIKRVQVKTVSNIDTSSRGEKVKCMLTHGSKNGKRFYTKEHADVIVLWVMTTKDWYIFPIEEVSEKLTISLFPTVKNSKSKYEVFKNNWEHI